MPGGACRKQLPCKQLLVEQMSRDSVRWCPGWNYSGEMSKGHTSDSPEGLITKTLCPTLRVSGMGWGRSNANAAGLKLGFSKVSLFFQATISRTKGENYMHSEKHGK